MNRLHGWIFPSQQLLYRSKRPSEPLARIPAVRNYSATTEPSEQLRRKHRHEIRTFRVDRLASVDQPILNLAGIPIPQLRISGAVLPKSFEAQNIKIPATYAWSSSERITPFPAGTRGVFYFHHVRGDNIQSQIRFRLCSTLNEFHHGEDLRRPDGSLWNISLRATARGPGKYGPALALLQEEFSLDPRNVDASHNPHRVISTLNPQKLPSSGQPVMDISRFVIAAVHLGASDTDGLYLYYGWGQLGEDLVGFEPYPPDTVGVFYYKQSRTAPTRLGELRFRLCRDVQEFAQGKDLLLPSGDPWGVSSLAIYCAQKYQQLRKSLTKEGLLEDSLYPGVPITFKSPRMPTVPLRTLSDPFVVDLSACSSVIETVPNPPDTALRCKCIYAFRNIANCTQPLFSGRAIVRLEEYPGLPPGDSPNGPLAAMRFLEMLTPVRRLSDDDYIQFPQQGQLLNRRGKTGEYVPWGFNPRIDRKAWIDWTARPGV